MSGADEVGNGTGGAQRHAQPSSPVFGRRNPERRVQTLQVREHNPAPKLSRLFRLRIPPIRQIPPVILVVLLALVVWLGTSIADEIYLRSYAKSFSHFIFYCEYSCPRYGTSLYVWRHITFLALGAAVLAPLPLAIFRVWRSCAFISFAAWLTVMAIVPVQYWREYDNGKGLEPMKIHVPDDIAAFRHPWCGSWAKADQYCQLAENGEAVCTGEPRADGVPSFGCEDWDVPNWCTTWTDTKDFVYRRWPFESLRGVFETYFYWDHSIETDPTRAHSHPLRSNHIWLRECDMSDLELADLQDEKNAGIVRLASASRVPMASNTD